MATLDISSAGRSAMAAPRRLAPRHPTWAGERHDSSGARVVRCCLMAAAAMCALLPALGFGQTAVPQAVLVPAPRLMLPGAVDSNSPAVWETREGRDVLHVLTSVDGNPNIAVGTGVARLGAVAAVTFTAHPGHGVWMEAVVPDVDGTWYGFYHNEIPAYLCGRPDRVIPRIGAARSTDFGQTWQDLGVVLEAPEGGEVCDSGNAYFLGGVGDFSAQLDAEQKFLYLFYSQYSSGPEQQGIAVARLPWAWRDEPVGRMAVWNGGVWVPGRAVERDTGAGTVLRWDYPAGTPLVAPARPWHTTESVVDAFWGASVHWNAHVQRYVMLLNRTSDEAFSQEGVYVAYAPNLDDPSAWSPPQRLLQGGQWYPQVIGLERGTGSDREASGRARFFMGGASDFFITFTLNR